MQSVEWSWPAAVPSQPKRAIEVLIRGCEFTKQLDAIMQHAHANGINPSSKFAVDLVVKILESVDEALSVLSISDELGGDPREPAGNRNGRKFVGSNQSCKTYAFKDRRGCFKRRRTAETWKRETSILIDDGHVWRKYGQKIIVNDKHPRSYYRCTNKADQGCQATKQVQKIQDDPPRYVTTYYGHHTCKNLFEAPQIILPATDNQEDSSILLSFGSNNPMNKQLCDPSLLPFASVKQENNSEVLKSSCNNKLSPLDYSSASNVTTYCETLIEPMTSLSSVPHPDEICSGVYPSDDEAGTYSSEMDIFLDPSSWFRDDVSQFEF